MTDLEPDILIRGARKRERRKNGHIKYCIECGIDLDYGIGFCSFLCLEISKYKAEYNKPRAIDYGFFLEIVKG
jgi:hypothetical protein